MAIVKKNNFVLFVFISYIIILLGRIPVYHMIGKDGMAYFSLAQEIFLLVGGVLFYSMKEGIASLIRYRVRREQFKGVRRLFLQSLFLALILGMILTVLLEAGCQYVLQNVLQLPLAVMTVRIALLGIPFLALAGVLQGYFQGFHMRAPGVHADFIFTAVFLGAGLISAEGFMLYGQKVSDLLHNGRFQYVYGAIGVSTGLVAASLLSLLYLLILYFVFRRSLEKDGSREREYLKNGESSFSRIRLILGSGGFHAFFYLTFALSGFGSVFIFFLLHKGDSAAASAFGMYYAGCNALLKAMILIILMVFYSSVRRVGYYQEREEFRMAREKLGMLLHRMLVVLLPFAILSVVLSENLSILLLGDTGAEASGAMQAGSIGILFGTLGYVFILLLMRLKQSMLAAVSAGAAMVLQMVLLVIMTSAGVGGALAPALSQMFFYLLLTTAGFVLVSRVMQYRQDWIRGAAIPTVLAAVMGVVTMLINRFLTPAAGRVAGTIVCVVVGILVYVILLLAARNMREEELNSSLFGRLLLKVGRLIHFY